MTPIFLIKMKSAFGLVCESSRMNVDTNATLLRRDDNNDRVHKNCSIVKHVIHPNCSIPSSSNTCEISRELMAVRPVLGDDSIQSQCQNTTLSSFSWLDSVKRSLFPQSGNEARTNEVNLERINTAMEWLDDIKSALFSDGGDDDLMPNNVYMDHSYASFSWRLDDVKRVLFPTK
jgi:hypothetical protein